MPRCLLALGANLGQSQTAIENALAALHAVEGIEVEALSSFHRTAPVGGPAGQDPFVNAAAVVDVQLQPEQVLDRLLRIEADLGRQRNERWAARHIDLDLLLFDQQVIASPRLLVPHPRMSFRPFVLAPAVEVAGDWRHPVLDATLDALWRRLRTGDDSVALCGATDDRHWCRQWLEANAPSLAIASPPCDAKLTIWFRSEGEQPPPGGPTLTLDSGAREESAAELRAALECVWPEGF